MTDPYAIVASGLKTVLDAEFAPEGVVAIHDKLHESLGANGIAVGISPIRQVPLRNNAVALDQNVRVEFFDQWNPQIDPTQQVDPTRITGFAERFRNAVRVATVGVAGSAEVWYYDITSIEYPLDPTGNVTRFVATIRSFGNNTGLVETS